MTEDYLSKVLESAYSNTICEWQAQGISDKEIIDKICELLNEVPPANFKTGS